MSFLFILAVRIIKLRETYHTLSFRDRSFPMKALSKVSLSKSAQPPIVVPEAIAFYA